LAAEACPNLLRPRLKCLARRPLEVAEVPPHGWHERHPPLRECGKAVERPGTHEGLWKGDVLEKYRLDTTCLCRTPVKQRQGTNDLQPDFPLVARCKRADEDLLVRRDPVGMFVRQFLRQIERALGDKPIYVGGERGQLDHERRVVFDQYPRLESAMLRRSPPLSCGRISLAREVFMWSATARHRSRSFAPF